MILGLCAAAGCSKVDVTDSSKGSGLTLKLSSNIQEPSVITKSTSLMKSGSIGLRVCEHEKLSVPHGYGMDNISASFRNIQDGRQNWTFKFNGISGSYPELVITEKKDADDNNVLADVFAYYPYSSNNSVEKVGFTAGSTSGGAVDAMFAEENLEGSVANKGLDPTREDVDEVEVNFTFHHVMSSVKFDVTYLNPNYNHPDGDGPSSSGLNSINIVRQHGHLYKSGTLNAMTGEISSLSASDGFSIGTDNLFIPTQPGEDYQDDDYVFIFRFDGMELPSRFYLKREHLRHGDSDVFGFMPGFIYKFHFIYDNFVRLESIEISEWTVQEEYLYEIEV